MINYPYVIIHNSFVCLTLVSQDDAAALIHGHKFLGYVMILRLSNSPVILKKQLFVQTVFRVHNQSPLSIQSHGYSS